MIKNNLLFLMPLSITFLLLCSGCSAVETTTSIAVSAITSVASTTASAAGSAIGAAL